MSFFFDLRQFLVVFYFLTYRVFELHFNSCCKIIRHYLFFLKKVIPSIVFGFQCDFIVANTPWNFEFCPTLLEMKIILLETPVL